MCIDGKHKKLKKWLCSILQMYIIIICEKHIENIKRQEKNKMIIVMIYFAIYTEKNAYGVLTEILNKSI